MIKSSFILLLVLLNFAVGSDIPSLFAHSPKNDPSLRIAGGKIADPHSAPFAVFIRITTYQNTKKRCTGSLITENYVLTAAHCLRGRYSAEVFLGAHDIGTNETSQVKFTVYSSSFIIHSPGADLALIRLPRSVDTTGRYIKTVNLPKKADARKAYDNKPATVYGWGVTRTYPNVVYTNVLRTVDLTVVPRTRNNPDCYYADIICTSGSGGKGVCGGDSGGPILVDGVQVGVTFTGPVDCESGDISTYTALNVYLDWLQQNSDLIIN